MSAWLFDTQPETSFDILSNFHPQPQIDGCAGLSAALWGRGDDPAFFGDPEILPRWLADEPSFDLIVGDFLVPSTSTVDKTLPAEPQMSVDTIDDVIVIARQDWDASGHGNFVLSANVSGRMIGYYEPSVGDGAPPGADADVHLIEIRIPGEISPELKAAAEELANIVAQIDEAIANLANDARLTLPNGDVVTGSELKALWGKVDFVVTDQNYGTNNAGRANPDGTFEINADHLIGYAEHGSSGLTFYVLHELAHITGAGLASSAQAWQDYREATPNNRESRNHFSTTGFFRWDEMFSNSLARALGNTIGVGVGNFVPTFNYQNW